LRTTSWTWSLTESLSVIVTPSILSDDTRWMPGKHGGGLVARLQRRLRVTIIFLDLWRLSMRLLVLAQCCMRSSSEQGERSLAAEMMTYVSSAYLRSLFPGVAALRSEASTTYDTGSVASPVQCWLRSGTMRKSSSCSSYSVSDRWNNPPTSCRHHPEYPAEWTSGAGGLADRVKCLSEV